MKTTKPSHRILAVFLTLNFLTTLVPTNYIYASNNGPNAPEVAGFEPVDATDMVNLGTGDLAYTLPLMEVDGFPITMAYHAGVTSTLDASWAGLGWYLNTGAINRQQIAVPDDWYAGKAINFISYEDAETTYNIGVGFSAGPAEAGVGISWGSGKGIQGSVEASVSLTNFLPVNAQDNFGLGVGASANTGGGYYLGAYANARLSGSAGLSSSIGYSNDGFSAGANLGVVQGTNNRFSTLGIGYNTSGSFSINAGLGGGDSFGSGSLNMGSFSSGDYDITTNSKGFKLSGEAIGIPVYIKFGRTKVTYSLRKGFLEEAYGSLYASEIYDDSNFNTPDNNFIDYQNRNVFMDAYEQALPQEEEEFISDYRPNEEKLNFNYAGYDNFEVQANGLNGRLKARLFENVTLINRGYNASSSETANKKNHVFYHNSGKSADREFGFNSNNQLHMYFEGAFSSKEIIAPSSATLNGNSLGAMVNDPAPASQTFETNPTGRATTPNYVEVFTNEELFQYGQANQILEPQTLPFSERTNNNLVDPNGIGAYKINSPDGKIYHFTIPVYHFETVKRSLLKTANQNPFSPTDISESRQYNKYATHWLLTAVTGPDYVDTNGNNQADSGDFGYWVRLDYGKWSDGYTWKQPYEDEARLYTTNLLSKIDEDDFGYFSFGRKQLYYLNKIVSREHTALFVKDIRHDAVGKEFDYSFLNTNAPGFNQSTISPSGNNGALNHSGDPHVKEISIPYREEYTLKLDRIALVKTEVAETIESSLGNGLGTDLPGYQENQVVNGTWSSPEFQSAYSNNYQYLLHQEDNVLDINDFNASGIQANVLREVRLQHSYDLAKNSPNSKVTVQNPFKGKLTLDNIQFRGKAGANYMPPYRFEYHDEDKENISLAGIREEINGMYGGDENSEDYRREYVKRKKELIDNWGFIQDDEDRWSLKSIQMPTGATINLTYEEDSYWTEAFSRRYWEDNLRIYIDESSIAGYYDIIISNDINIPEVDKVDFRNYFSVGERVFIDYWLCRRWKDGLFDNREQASFDLMENDETENSNVISVSQENVTIRVQDYPELLNGTFGDSFRILDAFFSKTENFRPGNPFDSSNVFESKPRGICPDDGGNDIGPNGDHWTMTYKLLANKIPEDEVGGGLRVSKIETVSSNGNVGVLEYDYTFPQGHERAGQSSGITSFAPVDGLQFVPYQSELPSPGVQYEYVTLSRKDGNGNLLDYTRYNYHVLQQLFNIFEENITLSSSNGEDASDEDSIFWTEVSQQQNGNITSKDIRVHVNTSMIGQFKNIEQFNEHDQLISKVSYDYTNGRPLDQEGKGRVQESFNSLKSIFETNSDGNNPTLKNRLLSISTRTDYSNILKKVTNSANGHTSSVTYGDLDPILGSYRESYTQKADGTQMRDYRIPAYDVYPNMGPKSVNASNKNMLTQQAMTISDRGANNNYKSTSASVTTWKNSTLYDSDVSQTNDGIWRKHESYVWDDTLDSDGTFGREIVQTDFNWTSAQTNPQWQKISETTRYDHWSSPLEVRDVNNNYASSVMGDDNKKVIATGNARASELYYSGAEYLGQESNAYAGGVEGAQNQSADFAHTGTYSSKTESGNTAFSVDGTVGANQNDISQTFRPGKYKASVWSYNGLEPELRYNGAVTVASETISAGAWTLYNYYLDFVPNSNANITLVNPSSTPGYFDDFRLHPVYCSMNSFVYNQWEELTHILGANNMATKYEYDQAGRLSNIYSEVEDFNGEGSGGFKLGSSYQYNYQTTSN